MQGAYVNGLLVDYLIPKVYLFDLLLIGNIIVFFLDQKNIFFNKKIKLKLNKIDLAIFILFCFFIIYQLMNIDLAGLLAILRSSLIIVFVLQIRQQPQLKKDLYFALILSLAWQSFLAYYQFFNQHSLAPYQWFGETNLQSFTGISHASFFQSEKILPYGSTAHPNILAGIVLIFSMILIDSQTFNRDWQNLFLFNALMIALLSQSLSALLTLALFFIYLISQNLEKKYQKWQKNIFIISLSLIFIISPFLINKLSQLKPNTNLYLSLNRRQMLNQAAWKMFLDKPVFGFSQNSFVKTVENYSQNREIVRFVQPAHHLGLLILSENGLLLIILLGFMIWRFQRYFSWEKLLILVPLASLDHYLLTQPAGIASLLIFMLSVSRIKKRYWLIKTKWEQW